MKEFGREGKDLSEKESSNFNTKNYKIKDLFIIQRDNGKYIRRYINDNKGEYPVFSGNTSGAFAYINSFDYDTPCLSWAIDGFAGYMMIHKEKFSATNHRGILIPKNSNLSLYYAKEIMEPLFRKNKKGRYGLDGKDEYTALPPYLIEDIEIPIPIDNDGNFDVLAQNTIAQKYEFISEVKNQLIEFQKMIMDTNIRFDLTNEFRNEK